MNTIKLYKVTCNKAYMATEQGTGYSLTTKRGTMTAGGCTLSRKGIRWHNATAVQKRYTTNRESIAALDALQRVAGSGEHHEKGSEFEPWT